MCIRDSCYHAQNDLVDALEFLATFALASGMEYQQKIEYVDFRWCWMGAKTHSSMHCDVLIDLCSTATISTKVAN